MSATIFTSREFNRGTDRAKKAASKAPVFITHRGQPTHVLLNIRDYQSLVEQQGSIIDSLGQPAGIENIEVEFPHSREPGRSIWDG